MKERKNGVRKTTCITRSATYHTGKIITCYAGKIDCDMMYSIPVLQTIVFPPARTIAVGELHSGTVCRSVSQCVAVRCSVSTLVEWRCSRWPRHLYCCTHTHFIVVHTHTVHTHTQKICCAHYQRRVDPKNVRTRYKKSALGVGFFCTWDLICHGFSH